MNKEQINQSVIAFVRAVSGGVIHNAKNIELTDGILDEANSILKQPEPQRIFSVQTIVADVIGSISIALLSHAILNGRQEMLAMAYSVALQEIGRTMGPVETAQSIVTEIPAEAAKIYADVVVGMIMEGSEEEEVIPVDSSDCKHESIQGTCWKCGGGE